MSISTPIRDRATADSSIAFRDVPLTPSLDRSAATRTTVADAVPAGATCLIVPVGSEGAPPAELGLDRATLAMAGFDGRVGQTLPLPRAAGPTLIAVGVGDTTQLDATVLRATPPAAFAQAAPRHERLAIRLVNTGSIAPGRPRVPSSRACYSPATTTTSSTPGPFTTPLRG
jgi:hypothetical protein